MSIHGAGPTLPSDAGLQTEVRGIGGGPGPAYTNTARSCCSVALRPMREPERQVAGRRGPRGLSTRFSPESQVRRSFGVVVTANHNPAIDNGVKIVDPAGSFAFQLADRRTGSIHKLTTSSCWLSVRGIGNKHLNVPFPAPTYPLRARRLCSVLSSHPSHTPQG